MTAKESQQSDLGSIVATNSLWNLLGYLISFILGFLITPFVILKIGVEDYGIYALMAAVIAPLGMSDLGFRRATIKYVSQYTAVGNYKEAGKYIRTTLWLNLIVSVIGVILIISLGSIVIKTFFNVDSGKMDMIEQCLYLMASWWFFNMIGTVFSSIPVALQKYKFIAIGNILSLTLTYSLVLIFVWYETGLFGYTFANALGVVMIFIYWIIIGKRMFPNVSLLPKFHGDVWKVSFKFGAWDTVSQIGAIISSNIEKYLIGAILSTTALGIYNIAVTLQQKLFVAIFKLSEVLFPAFSSLDKEDKAVNFNILFRAGWIISCISVIIINSMIPLSYGLLDLWINEEVAREGFQILQSILLGAVIALGNSAMSSYLLSSARTKLLSIITFSETFIIGVGSLILLKEIGIKGAGVSILMATVFRRIILMFIIKRIFKSKVNWAQVISSIYLPLMIGFTLIISLMYFKDIHISGWIELITWYITLIFVTTLLIFIATLLFPPSKEYNKDIRKIINGLVTLVKS